MVQKRYSGQKPRLEKTFFIWKILSQNAVQTFSLFILIEKELPKKTVFCCQFSKNRDLYILEIGSANNVVLKWCTRLYSQYVNIGLLIGIK